MYEIDRMIKDYWGEWLIVHTFKELYEVIDKERFRVISIGNLLKIEDNTKDIAQYIKNIYDFENWKYPIIVNNTGGEEFRQYLLELFKR